MAERNIYLDVLRGLAILIVVFGHALQSANGMNPGLPTQQVIMTFWMPLFFLIGGYADGMTKGGSGLRNKVFRLLVPYLIWSQVVFSFDLFGSVAYSLDGQVHSIVSSEFWFLRLLFFCWFACYLYRKVFIILEKWPSSFLKMLVSGGMSAGVAFIIGGTGIFHYLPLYVVGIVVFKSWGRVSARIRGLLMIVGTLVFIVESYFLLRVQSTLIGRMLDLNMAFTGSLAVCLLARMLMGLKCVILPLAFCGRQSLGIYAIHWCLLFHTDLLGLRRLVRWGLDVHVVALMGFVFWLLICVCLIWLFGKVDVTNRLLLGNKNRRTGE